MLHAKVSICAQYSPTLISSELNWGQIVFMILLFQFFLFYSKNREFFPTSESHPVFDHSSLWVLWSSFCFPLGLILVRQKDSYVH